MKLIFFIIYFFIISCSSYKVNNYYDEFEQFEWFRYENNFILEDYIGIDLEINPQIWIQGKTEIYSLQVKITGKEKLHIEEGISFLISADGEKINLGNDINRAFRKKVSKDTFYEEAWFEVDRDILYKLAFSDDCKLKINGKEEFIKGSFSEFNKKTFKDFYKNHVDGSLWEIPALNEELNRNTFSIKSRVLKKPETTLNKFSKILLQNGWEINIDEVDWPYHLDYVTYIHSLKIKYEIPVEVNQYVFPQFEIFQIMFTEQNKIPNVTKYQTQTYPCSKCLNTFPLTEFDFLFPNMSISKLNDIENWAVFRKENDVFVIVGEENKQQYNQVFGYLVEYFKSETNIDIKILKDRILQNYLEKKDLYKAEKLVQEFLKENNFYLGEVDGLFGQNSRESLQKFLKEKNFYEGDINGLKNIELENALKSYQNFLNVKQTGWINIETAEKMMK